MLETHDLAKYFRVGDGLPIRAVDGVSLTVAAGELVTLYGPSGSGKSTLLDLIAGFLLADHGSVCVDGRDIARLSEREHAEMLLRIYGIIGRPEELLPGASALENAALKLWRADRKHAEARIVPLLAELGLQARMRHPVNKLSMGERSRVLIAQALSLQPKLVLADEPTGSLDTQRSREVLTILRDVAHGGAAVLIATHDPQAADYADRVVVLRDGRLTERALHRPLNDIDDAMADTP